MVKSARRKLAAAGTDDVSVKWIEHRGPNGKPFYINTETNVTMWEKPAEMVQPHADQFSCCFCDKLICPVEHDKCEQRAKECDQCYSLMCSDCVVQCSSGVECGVFCENCLDSCSLQTSGCEGILWCSDCISTCEDCGTVACASCMYENGGTDCDKCGDYYCSGDCVKNGLSSCVRCDVDVCDLCCGSEVSISALDRPVRTLPHLSRTSFPAAEAYAKEHFPRFMAKRRGEKTEHNTLMDRAHVVEMAQGAMSIECDDNGEARVWVPSTGCVFACAGTCKPQSGEDINFFCLDCAEQHECGVSWLVQNASDAHENGLIIQKMKSAKGMESMFRAVDGYVDEESKRKRMEAMKARRTKKQAAAVTTTSATSEAAKARADAAYLELLEEEEAQGQREGKGRGKAVGRAAATPTAAGVPKAADPHPKARISSVSLGRRARKAAMATSASSEEVVAPEEAEEAVVEETSEGADALFAARYAAASDVVGRQRARQQERQEAAREAAEASRRRAEERRRLEGSARARAGGGGGEEALRYAEEEELRLAIELSLREAAGMAHGEGGGMEGRDMASGMASSVTGGGSSSAASGPRTTELKIFLTISKGKQISDGDLRRLLGQHGHVRSLVYPPAGQKTFFVNAW